MRTRTSIFLFASLFIVPLASFGVVACDQPKTDAPPAASASAAPPAAASASTAPSAAPAESAAATPSATASAPAASASAATAVASSAPAAASGAASGTAKTPTFPACTPPNCPLQAWMKTNTAPAMAANDLPALAGAFDKIVKLAPPGYTNWASIAKDGSAAAGAGKIDAAKAACKSCHDQYKAKYKAEMRGRPIPS